MKQERKLIVYIGSFVFPMGDAVAKRALGLGKAFDMAGYSVAYIGEDRDVALGEISEEKYYEQFRYCSIHKSQSSKEHYMFKNDLKQVEEKLTQWNEEEGILAVVFCGTKCALFANGLVKICKKMRIPTIADSMDWLRIHTGNILFDLIKQADISYEMKSVNKKANGVIAISSFLADYYNKRGMKTIVIPPLSPYESREIKKKENERTTFVYAGVPCRLGKPLKNVEDAKDRLDLAIMLLYNAHTKGCDFQFIIYGLTQEQYNVIFPQQEEMIVELINASKLKFMGYVQETIVRDAIEKADYMILLRDRNRTSMAGFPTKIAESITLGTPVITTNTSDIYKYVESGKEGYFLESPKTEIVREKIIQILTEGKNQEMKNKVQKNISFMPETYTKKIRAFVESITEI